MQLDRERIDSRTLRMTERKGDRSTIRELTVGHQAYTKRMTCRPTYRGWTVRYRGGLEADRGYIVSIEAN